MKEGWKEVKLADYYKISSGLSKSADQFGSGYPFVSFKDVFWNFFLPEELDQLVNTSEKEQVKCSVKKGDVFLTRTSEKVAELGMSSVALKDYPKATFNGFTKRLRPTTTEIDPVFIGFYLRSPQFRAEITAYSTLTTRASLNNSIIGRLRINLPPLPIQRKIASILYAYDDLIENNLKRIKLLEEKAQLTYEEWFVRMKFPGHETAKFDEETGLPEGWEKDIINTYFKTSSGGTPSRKKLDRYYKNGSINWVKTKELLGSFIFETEEKITQEAINESSAKIFPENTIIMGMYGGVHGEGRKSTLGQLGIITQKSSTNQACCAFIPVGKKPYSLPYLFYFLKERQRFFLNISMGAAQQNISQQLIKSSMYIQPKEELLNMFDSIVQPIFDSTKILHKQNQLLKEARDILLPRLMSGVINV